MVKRQMVKWKPVCGFSVDGSPIVLSRPLGLERDIRIISIIQAMPDAKKIDLQTASLLYCEAMNDLQLEAEHQQDWTSYRNVCSKGLVIWCMENGYQIILQPGDYKLVSDDE